MNFIQKLKTYFTKSISISLRDATGIKQAFDQWVNGVSGDVNGGYVTSCSNTWGLSFAKTVFRLYDVSEENEEVTEHPLINLLKKPFPGITKAQMMHRISDDLIYEGNSYWLKLRDGLNVPRYLYPLYADRMSTQPYGYDRVDYYEYNSGTGIIKFPKEDILHIPYFSRSSNIKGAPLVDKIKDVRTTEALQIKYRMQLYKKAGFLGATFSTKASLKSAEFERLKNMLNQRYGGEENNFNVALFDNDMKPVPTAYSPKDMQIIEDRNLNRDEICAAFGVNKIMFGQSENIQRGNADTVFYIFYYTIIDPILDHIDQCITQSFEPDFSANGFYPYEVRHDVLAQKDVERDANIYTKYTEAGLIKPSEIRSELGYEEDPELDRVWLERMSKGKQVTAN